MVLTLRDLNLAVRCPTLNEFLPAIRAKTGWPWTEESQRLLQTTPDGNPWPKISIVTPPCKQGKPEHIIIDGRRVDNSAEITKKGKPWLSYY